MRIFQENLRVRVFISVMAALIAVVVAMDLMFLDLQREKIKESLISRGQGVTHTLADNLRLATFAGDIESMEKTAKSMLDQPDIVSVFIYNSSGELLSGKALEGYAGNEKLKLPDISEVEEWSFEDDSVIAFFHVIKSIEAETDEAEIFGMELDKENLYVSPLGVLALSISKDELGRAFDSLMMDNIYLLLAFIPIALLITYIVVKNATYPLNNLLEKVGSQAGNDQDQNSQGDLGLLTSAFDRLLNDLSLAFEEVNKLNETLEFKVDERTKALSETNDMLRKEVERREVAEESLAQLLKERTQKLKEKQSQLLHADKLVSLGRLSAGLAHEINNPICGMTLSIQEVLSRNDINPEVEENLTECMEQCKRISKLINDLGRLKRPTTDEREPVEIHQFLDAVYFWMRKTFQAEGVKVDRDYSDAELISNISADQLSQVFLNLFNNAIDAVAKSSMKFIGISTRDEGTKITIRVEDSGDGVKRQDAEKIFEPFYTTKPAGQGTGLGLSVSHEIVASHGGTLKVISEPGRGGIFEVSLPKWESVVDEE